MRLENTNFVILLLYHFLSLVGWRTPLKYSHTHKKYQRRKKAMSKVKFHMLSERNSIKRRREEEESKVFNGFKVGKLLLIFPSPSQ